MATCKMCHEKQRFMDLSDTGYCKNCLKQWPSLQKPKHTTPVNTKPLPHERRSRILMTTETALDIPITQRLGIVTAEAVVGMNIIKDMMLEVRDLVGGRSKTQQNAMRDIKEELFDRLRDDAARLNADMVVGVDLRFSDFGSRGNAILATAIGTAVKVEKGDRANPSTTEDN